MSGLWSPRRGLCDSLRPPACAPRVRRCRRDRPRLSGRVGLPDQQDRPLDAGAGGRAESASCGAGGRAAHAGDSHPRLLAQHSTAVLDMDTGRGDLTPRRFGHQGGTRCGPGEGRLPSPVRGGHATTGAEHTGVQDAGPEETEERGVTIRPYATHPHCVEFLSLNLGSGQALTAFQRCVIPMALAHRLGAS